MISSASDQSTEEAPINKPKQLETAINRSSSRRSSRSNKTPNYNESSDEQSSSSSDDDKEVEIVEPPPKKRSPKKRSSPVKKSVLESLSPVDSKDRICGANDVNDVNDDELKPSAATSTTTATARGETKLKTEATNKSSTDGIDVLIPHSLLNKHQGAGKSECTMLVQINGGDDDDHLDFHGQSGAVGRFEADGHGVTLDLKGYQYRGTIRPGPTAMVIALTRDNQFKVESITDEFVTLDNERTNMMDKFDAVVEGEMDESYNVTDENVNRCERKRVDGDDGEEETGAKKKRKSALKGDGKKKTGGSGGTKKRKAAASKK